MATPAIRTDTRPTFSFRVISGNNQDLGRVAYCFREQLSVDANVFDGKGAPIIEKPWCY
jgi:hypothetical protein